MADTGAAEYQERKESVGQFEIHIVSFRLGGRYHCKVDNVSPGAVIARAEGATREEAEQAAVATAREEIGKTRVRREA
jgi:hypothetical protein